jgi:hypothetical protein
VGDQDNGSPGRPISSGLQVAGEPGQCRARPRPLGDLGYCVVGMIMLLKNSNDSNGN